MPKLQMSGTSYMEYKDQEIYPEQIFGKKWVRFRSKAVRKGFQTSQRCRGRNINGQIYGKMIITGSRKHSKGTDEFEYIQTQ